MFDFSDDYVDGDADGGDGDAGGDADSNSAEAMDCDNGCFGGATMGISGDMDRSSGGLPGRRTRQGGAWVGAGGGGVAKGGLWRRCSASMAAERARRSSGGDRVGPPPGRLGVRAPGPPRMSTPPSSRPSET